MHETIDRRADTGPFDIIGDVHGCADELRSLLHDLGYRIGAEPGRIAHPDGRRLVFVGDLVNRGPDTPDALRLAMAAVASGGYAVEGNHDEILSRWMAGEAVDVTKALQCTIDQLAAEPADFRAEAKAFLSGLPSYCWLDGGRLVVVHAGLKQEMLGDDSAATRKFAVHGESTRNTDEFGRPGRADWAQNYRGETAIVHGHTPAAAAEWLNNTICIDTGCVAGGKLTALRWPERVLVEVPADRAHAEPARPFIPPLAGPHSA